MLYTFLEKLSSKFTDHFFLEAEAHIRLGLKKKILTQSNHCLLPPGIDFTMFDRIVKTGKPEIPDFMLKPIEDNKKIVTMIACLVPARPG